MTARPDPGRVRGCLLAGGLGDALGLPIEFYGEDQIPPGPPERLAYLGRPPAKISDDTQMTLFVAEGLIEARRGGMVHPTRVVARALDRWYVTQFQHGLPGGRRPWTPDPARDGGLLGERRLHAARAPGGTNMGSLHDRHESGPSWAALRAYNDSKGCGAVMRAAPCGLVAATREDAFVLACDQGIVTHAHPGGYLPAGALAAMVWDLVRGVPIAAAVDAALALVAAEPDHHEVIDLLTRAREQAAAGPPTAAIISSELGEGWVGDEALAIALLCALTIEGEGPDAVSAALWRAAAHAGDSDSTGAICGNLLGAMLGERALPRAWLDELELRDVIETMANAVLEQ